MHHALVVSGASCMLPESQAVASCLKKGRIQQFGYSLDEGWRSPSKSIEPGSKASRDGQDIGCVWQDWLLRTVWCPGGSRCTWGPGLTPPLCHAAPLTRHGVRGPGLLAERDRAQALGVLPRLHGGRPVLVQHPLHAGHHHGPGRARAGPAAHDW